MGTTDSMLDEVFCFCVHNLNFVLFLFFFEISSIAAFYFWVGAQVKFTSMVQTSVSGTYLVFLVPHCIYLSFCIFQLLACGPHSVFIILRETFIYSIVRTIPFLVY